MRTKRRILFQGPVARKMVKHYAHPHIEAEVIPLVVIQEGKNPWGDDELRWGMILQCLPQPVLKARGKEGKDLLTPFEIDITFAGWSNPVRWWRALQLLDAIPVLDHRNLGLALWIATDRPDEDDTGDRESIEELCSTFREDCNYEEIMARPVPTEIIQLTVGLIQEGLRMPSVLYDLTDEIEAGSIEWSQELKRVGVRHPDDRRAARAVLAEVVARYQPYLSSYAAFRGCTYDHQHKSLIMTCIEQCIYAAIERGIELDYGMDITALLGILRAELTTDATLTTVAKKHPSDQAGCAPYRRPTPEERFGHVLTWITDSCSHAGPLPSHDELSAILQQLITRWEAMPVTHPLVSS